MSLAVQRRSERAPGGWSARACVALLLALAGPACTRDLGLLTPADAGGTADLPQDQSSPSDAGGDGDAAADGDGGGASGLCGGGRVHFPNAGGTCASTLASRSHRYALCSCSDWSPAASINTDAFSSNLAITAGPVPAAVGVNGKLAPTADLSIRGSVYVSGAAGITDSGHLDIRKSLRSAGPVTLTAAGSASVYGDAYVGGDVMGALHVGGTLHLPPTAMMGAATALTITREAVSVPDPCDCTTPFDVTAFITATGSANDNASIGLDPDQLVDPTDTVNLDIPCGTFFLSSITSDAEVNLRIHGRALLAIAGGVTLSGGMTVIFDPGAELDLLIGGALTSYGPYPVGAYTAAALRVWMAGSSPISFYGHPVGGGIFQAPLSDVTAPDGMEFYGSIVAAAFDLGGQVLVHYDQAVLSGGLPCGDPQQDPIP